MSKIHPEKKKKSVNKWRLPKDNLLTH